MCHRLHHFSEWLCRTNKAFQTAEVDHFHMAVFIACYLSYPDSKNKSRDKGTRGLRTRSLTWILLCRFRHSSQFSTFEREMDLDAYERPQKRIPEDMSLGKDECSQPSRGISGGSLQHVFQNYIIRFLSASDLLQLALFCCKDMKDYLTYDMVTQTVIRSTGNLTLPKTRLHVILQLFNQARIYQPSPLRVLQLCLANTCENVLTDQDGNKRQCKKRPRDCFNGCGLHFCASCIMSRSKMLRRCPKNRQYFDNPRIQFFRRANTGSMWIRTNTTVIQGENCGPLITTENISSAKQRQRSFPK
jgi:hypothetical protein